MDGLGIWRLAFAPLENVLYTSLSLQFSLHGLNFDLRVENKKKHTHSLMISNDEKSVNRYWAYDYIMRPFEYA